MLNKNNEGFTLIELLVVIAIIGLLASVILASLNTARMKSRDSRRISDIGQIRIALASYADDHEYKYPDSLYEDPDFATSSYMEQVPVDPKGGNYYYASSSNGYCLAAQLENDKNAQLHQSASSSDYCNSAKMNDLVIDGNADAGENIYAVTP